MASGGIARVGYAGGKIVKGASWVIKNLRKSRQEVIEGKGQFSKLNPMEQESLKWELSALIKQLERGGKIPDDMLQTMRQDKRFKDIVKTPSTDPELRELEEVLLDHRKQELLDDWEGEAWDSGRDVVDSLTGPKEIKKRKQIEMLKDFDTTGRKKNASGGIARVGYGQGKGVDLDRRMILKGMGALAALPVVGKFFKWAKPLAKKLDDIILSSDFELRDDPKNWWWTMDWSNDNNIIQFEENKHFRNFLIANRANKRLINRFIPLVLRETKKTIELISNHLNDYSN